MRTLQIVGQSAGKRQKQDMQPICDMFATWAGRPLKRHESKLLSQAFSDPETIELITKVIYSVRPPQPAVFDDDNQTVIEDYLLLDKEEGRHDKRKTQSC